MQHSFVVFVIALLGVIVGAALAALAIGGWVYREIANQRLIIVRSRNGEPLPRLPLERGDENFPREIGA